MAAFGALKAFAGLNLAHPGHGQEQQAPNDGGPGNEHHYHYITSGSDVSEVRSASSRRSVLLHRRAEGNIYEEPQIFNGAPMALGLTKTRMDTGLRGRKSREELMSMVCLNSSVADARSCGGPQTSHSNSCDGSSAGGKGGSLSGVHHDCPNPQGVTSVTYPRVPGPSETYSASGAVAESASESYVNPLLSGLVDSATTCNAPSSSSECCYGSTGGGYYYPSQAAALLTKLRSPDLTYSCHSSNEVCQASCGASNCHVVSISEVSSDAVQVCSPNASTKPTSPCYGCDCSQKSKDSRELHRFRSEDASSASGCPCSKRQCASKGSSNHYEPCCTGRQSRHDDVGSSCAAVAVTRSLGCSSGCYSATRMSGHDGSHSEPLNGEVGTPLKPSDISCVSGTPLVANEGDFVLRASSSLLERIFGAWRKQPSAVSCGQAKVEQTSFASRRCKVVKKAAVSAVILVLVAALCSVVTYMCLTDRPVVASSSVLLGQDGVGKPECLPGCSTGLSSDVQGAEARYDFVFRVTNEAFRSAYADTSSKVYRDIAAKLSSELNSVLIKIAGPSISAAVIRLEPFQSARNRVYATQDGGLVVHARVLVTRRGGDGNSSAQDEGDMSSSSVLSWETDENKTLSSLGSTFLRSLLPAAEDTNSVVDNLPSAAAVTSRKRSRLGQFDVDVESIQITALESSSSGALDVNRKWTPLRPGLLAPPVLPPSSTLSSVIPVWGQWGSWSKCPTSSSCSNPSTQVRRRKCHFWDQTKASHSRQTRDAEDSTSPVHCSSGTGSSDVEVRSCQCSVTTVPSLVSSSPEPVVTSSTAESTTTKVSVGCGIWGCRSGEICLVFGVETSEESARCRGVRIELNPYNCGGLCRAPHDTCYIEDEAGNGDPLSNNTVYRCLSATECLPGEWRCGSGMCIPREKRCDGHFNCFDKTDEFGCVECSVGEFHCGNETSCLLLSKKCNGILDCWDGSDELECGTLVAPRGSVGSGAGVERTSGDPGIRTSRPRLPVLPRARSCDSKTEFTCVSGQCVQRRHYCDGFADCFDKSDEPWGCSEDCKPQEFACRNGRCVFSVNVCDGVDDCGDFTDEASCVKTSPVTGRRQTNGDGAYALPSSSDNLKVMSSQQSVPALESSRGDPASSNGVVSDDGTPSLHRHSLSVPKAVQLLT